MKRSQGSRFLIVTSGGGASMAYGDTGVDGPGGGNYWKAPYPWTEGKLVGVDAQNVAKTVAVRFLIDTGATTSQVATDTLANFKLTFQGVITKTVASGKVALSTYKGLTFQIRAGQKDLTFTGLFQMNPVVEATQPSLVGNDLAKDTGAIFTVDIKGGKVTIGT